MKTPARVEAWDETPARIGTAEATPASGQDWGATPSQSVRNKFDEKIGMNLFCVSKIIILDGGLTPGWGIDETPYQKSDIDIKVDATPSSKRRSRWDLTPSQTPSNGIPSAVTPSYTPAQNGDATPMLTPGGSTPMGTAAR